MADQLHAFTTGTLPQSDLDACVALIAAGEAVTDPETAVEYLPHCLFVVAEH